MRSRILLSTLLLLSSATFAAPMPNLKAAPEVTAGIKVIHIDVHPADPSDITQRIDFTYEALRSCGNLTIFGHGYDKDGAQLQMFRVGAGHLGVVAGQKFKDIALAPNVPVGGTIMLDKLFCNPY